MANNLDLTKFNGFVDEDGLAYFKQKNDTLTDEKIAVETNRAKSVESSLNTAISNEVSRAKSAEETLTTNLNNEISRAKAAEQTNATAISNETTRATNVENTLTTNLNAEISRAKSAEQTNATAISEEVTRAKNAESNLDSKKIDKTVVATSSTLGLVKSGTDITVDSSGNVSVNDNSHKHTVSNISDLTATATELNIMDGVTATTAEINKLDGLTATTTELNYMDGVTSNVQTQLNAKVPTSRTVNGKALSSNITLSYSDVGADASGSASNALASAKNYTDTKVANLVGSAPDTLNTLEELADALNDNADIVDVLNTSIATKVDKVDGKGLSTNDYTTTEKTKLSGIATGAEVNQNAFSNIVVGSTTIAADTKTDSLTLAGSNVTLTPDATNDKVTIGITKENVVAALGYTPPTTDTNTHYTSKNVVGSSTATSNTTSALTNGNVYLNSVENGAVTSTHKISGSGATTVTTDASGNIVISSTDTNTNTVTTVSTTGSGNAITSLSASNGAITATKGSTFLTAHPTISTSADTTSTATATHGGTVTMVDSITRDSNGHVTKVNTKTVTLPSDNNTVYTHPTYTARTGNPTANQTPAFGGTATVSQITSDGTGHVTGATDRTITIPSTLSNGTGTAGLIKTTSTVTSSSGYTACPVISGVPYYKDTNTTYTLSSFGITATAAELNALDGITATVTELNYCDGVTSNIQTQLDGKAASSHGTHVSYGTSASALGTSSAGSASTVSRSDHVHALPALTSCTGTLTVAKGGTGATTAAGALTNLGLTATAAELNYCDGVTSNIQTQLNAKAASSHTHSYAGSSSAGGAATSANRLYAPSIATVNGTTYTIDTYLTLIAGTLPLATQGHYTWKHSWSYAGNGLLSATIGSTTHTIQLAGAHCEFTGSSGGEYILRITTATTSGTSGASFTAGATYQYNCHGSNYTPTWTIDNAIIALSVSGKTITYTKNNGATGTITTQDTNTTYSAATTSAAGLMSASDKSKLDAITASADSVSFSASLTSGTKVGTITINGTATDLYCQTNTNTTYSIAKYGTSGLVKPAYSTTGTASLTTTSQAYSNSPTIAARTTTSGRYYGVEIDSAGRLFVNVPWTDTNTNTTYSAGTGISLSGTTFSNAGVRSISTGSTNGTISVNTGGASAEVAVKGLGSAAYTASTAYAAASHTHSYAGSSSAGGAATSATTVYGTLTNPTSVTNYYIPFHSSASSANKSLLNNNGFYYRTLEGTTSANGYGILCLGNSTASGTAGNKYGSIMAYGTSSYYTQLTFNNTTANRTIAFPNNDGDLVVENSIANNTYVHAIQQGKVITVQFSGTCAQIKTTLQSLFTSYSPTFSGLSFPVMILVTTGKYIPGIITYSSVMYIYYSATYGGTITDITSNTSYIVSGTISWVTS